MNENQRWYYAVDEQTHGPVDAPEVKRLIDERAISAATWMVVEGREDWVLAKDSVFADCFNVPTQCDLISRSKIDEEALSTVGPAHEPEAVSQAGSSQNPVNGPARPSTLIRRRWYLLASGFLMLAVIGVSLHHAQHQRSTRDVIAELHEKFEKKDSKPAPALTTQEQQQTQFDTILAAFFSLNRRKLPSDIQGFRFGSSMDDVAANCLKQYGQPLATTNPGSLAFIVRTTKSEDTTAFSIDTTPHDSWIMVFGFYQERLVYISKTYRHALDPRKTSSFMSNYFKVVPSRDVDLFGVPGLFESENYVGLLNLSVNSSDFSSFWLFDIEFLRRVLDSHFREPFQNLIKALAQTDFRNINQSRDDVVLSFDEFPDSLSSIDEFKMTSEQMERNQFTEGMPDAACSYLGHNLKMLILQTLFPPLSGTIKKHLGQNSWDAAVYYWSAQDHYYVNVKGDGIVIGRIPDSPNPDRL